MIRAHRLLAPGETATAALTACLGFDERHRRRMAITTREGEQVLLDLAEATRLRDGDLIEMEDGRILAIAAQAEEVADIHAADGAALVRLAWHLGNRHTPTAVLGDRLRIRRDHVLEAMVERLGGTVTATSAPFDPEVGAYHDGGGHGHHHHGH